MDGIKVLGTGSYKPPDALTNAMLETIIDTSDEWIVSRTGVKQRAMSGPEETNLDMSVNAAKGALEMSGIDIGNIGVVIAATCTGDYQTPSLSCLLQESLGIPDGAIAMDLNCACSGFVFAMKTAYAFLADMPDKCALVVGCEMLTKMIDYTDRSTCIIFGDGAGAAVIRRDPAGSFFFEGGAKGNKEVLYCNSQYLANNPFIDKERFRRPSGVFMNGQEVFRFALETAPESINKVLDMAGVELSDVDHFILHQANQRITDGIAKRLRQTKEKFFENIATTGNTSSASVAIALDEMNRSGMLKSGDKIIMSAFGGGLTYASVYFVW